MIHSIETATIGEYFYSSFVFNVHVYLLLELLTSTIGSFFEKRRECPPHRTISLLSVHSNGFILSGVRQEMIYKCLILLKKQ